MRDERYSFPASFNQQRLWFLYKWEPDSAAYNFPVAHRLKGALDVEALIGSFNEIVRRHESLRTTFAAENGETLQLIAPALTLDCPVVDLQGHPDREAELDRRLSREAQRRFSLETGPLVRAILFRLSDQEHVLLWTMHHIVADGWSCGVFFDELQVLYDAFRLGRPSDLPELPIQFADYAVWQREWLKGAELDRQRHYWKRQLEGLGALELPTDRPRPKVQTYNGATRALHVSAELTDALKAFGRREQATLFMVLAAALQAVLQRYSGQDDIALGVPIAGRNRAELEGMIGFFANTLVLRTDLSGTPTFRELLARVRETAVAAYAHQDLPFEKLVEDLKLPRDTSRNPLFQVMFAMQKAEAALKLGGLALSPVPAETRTAKFDLTFYVTETSEGLSGTLEYNTDLFDAATIDRLVAHYQVLLEGAATAPHQRVSDLPLLTASERRQILVDWNDTQTDYARDICVHQWFESQVTKAPDAVAVVCEDRSLTYGALNGRANQLAHQLRGLGVRPGVLVGIFVERSVEMVVALLATLKAGGTYVPLDPALPSPRLAFMASDARLAVILTQESLKEIAPPIQGISISLDAARDEIGRQPTGNPPLAATAEDIAYVLYTSGSTGRPKGVDIPHRALTNFLWSMRSEPGCTSRDVLLAVTSLSFDIAGLEIFLPLVAGGRVELASRRVAADGRLLKARIDRCLPTLMQATPATWRMLIDAGWTGTSGMVALCGGEELPRDLAGQLQERTAALWNMYGPTETTIWSSVDRVHDDCQISIGRPIANTQLYILDKNLQPLPVGVAGELFIGGDGMAAGYRNRPELTRERFAVHPDIQPGGARLYRTGDRARYLPDGRVAHLGRLDHQVKLRGFRIELGEIETAFAQHESVRQAVVIAREDRAGDRCLTAYLIPAPGRSIDAGDLRQHLRRTLPDYMVPQFLVALDEFPLTPNGKIDRNRLPAPEPQAMQDAATRVAPRNATEQRVADILARILHLERVGIHDNFFDLGGHSLLAVQLISRLTDEFEVELPLQVLFEAPTVAQIAQKLTGSATERRLCAVWERVLGTRPIGRRDSFLDLQGSVDRFDQMLSAVRGEFGVFAEGLPVVAILKEPTVEALARLIDSSLESAPSLVVPLQPRGSGRPLFLIHAGGGYVFFYRALASRLGSDRPVYAVRAETSTDGQGRPFDKSKSIEELACRYISEIKKVQREGPYSLGGACFGGVIAFEMARQLRARGEEVMGPVLLFDAFVENNPHAPRSGTVAGRLRDRIGTHLTFASQLGAADALGYLVRKAVANAPSEARLAARRLTGRLGRATPPALPTATPTVSSDSEPATLEQKHLDVMHRFMSAAERLLATYTPAAYAGQLVLFKASAGRNPEPLWAGLAREGSTVHEMPGVHLDMMEEPVVSTTAALVTTYLATFG